MAHHPWVYPIGAGADQDTASPEPGEDEAEGLGGRHQPAGVSSVHGGMARVGREGGEDPHATWVIEGEQPNARRA